ncbi:hypothetical protein B7759_01320 [Burkholderia glumae]|nr:hypothetical protein KS03_2765 [Burkholderia glumae LMG 2196 = ATCC 33617]QKM54438.1 hypothetical protein CG017_02473 [Burkholderia glumae]QTP32743.1 hypothetical protein B7759_01320 [Burkholderia glumae]
MCQLHRNDAKCGSCILDAIFSPKAVRPQYGASALLHEPLQGRHDRTEPLDEIDGNLFLTIMLRQFARLAGSGGQRLFAKNAPNARETSPYRHKDSKVLILSGSHNDDVGRYFRGGLLDRTEARKRETIFERLAALLSDVDTRHDDNFGQPCVHRHARPHEPCACLPQTDDQDTHAWPAGPALWAKTQRRFAHRVCSAGSARALTPSTIVRFNIGWFSSCGPKSLSG